MTISSKWVERGFRRQLEMSAPGLRVSLLLCVRLGGRLKRLDDSDTNKPPQEGNLLGFPMPGVLPEGQGAPENGAPTQLIPALSSPGLEFRPFNARFY
jgi:hypothetical protein